MLLLVKCYAKKMVKSPSNCVILPLPQTQVDNQQQHKKTWVVPRGGAVCTSWNTL